MSALILVFSSLPLFFHQIHVSHACQLPHMHLNEYKNNSVTRIVYVQKNFLDELHQNKLDLTIAIVNIL
jgi:hypothetical protein